MKQRERMPHYSTWSRVLGHAVEPAEVRYGVTSLPAHVVETHRLLELTRGHWGD